MSQYQAIINRFSRVFKHFCIANTVEDVAPFLAYRDLRINVVFAGQLRDA